MSAFTAVDLSRLNAPALIEALDYESIFAAMLAKLIELDPQFDALTESDPTYKVLQVAAYRELQIRQRVNEAARANMLAYAMGSDLDHIGALFGVQRLQLDPGNPVLSIPPTMESDTDLRRRIQLAPEGFSVAGPEGAYVFHAIGSDPGVLDAAATSPSPGEVVVAVMSRTGDGTASPELIASVAAVLSADNVRPMTDHVTVVSAEIVEYEIEAEIFTFAGPETEVVLAEAQARIERYIDESHRLGRDVTLSGCYSALHTEGVQRVNLISPAADIVVDRTQATFCTSLTVGYGGIDE